MITANSAQLAYLQEYGIFKHKGLGSVVFLCVLEQQEDIIFELKNKKQVRELRRVWG